MYLLSSEELDVIECISIVTWTFCGPIPADVSYLH